MSQDFTGRMGRNQGRGRSGLVGTTQAKMYSQECAERNRAQRAMESKHIQLELKDLVQDQDEMG